MRRVKCTLYVYCHGLSKASAPLRVSYNKLNPSHRGRGRGRGRPGCGVEGWRRPQTSGLSPGHQAGHRPPCTAHQSPWTFGLMLFRRLDCERRKTQFSVDSAGAYRWAGEQDGQAWVGGRLAPAPQAQGLAPLSPSPRRTPSLGYLLVVRWRWQLEPRVLSGSSLARPSKPFPSIAQQELTGCHVATLTFLDQSQAWVMNLHPAGTLE